MEDKKIKQEIDTNKFITYMEHPTNEEIKKEIELGLKSKNIPDEIKEQIKSKFYNIENIKKNIGEEYDRYLVNLLSKKRKDFKYLQAIFLIINNIEKNKILKKEGIVSDIQNEEVENGIEIDNDWYIDIQIDLVYNDNNYYHKYIKKIVNELFELLNKEFLNKYIKSDFIKKGESYYKNNKEEFLSEVISLFEKLHNLTKIVDKNEPKRKRKKKKNKNKNLINNNEDSEIKDNDNKIIYDKNQQPKNNNENLEINQNNIDNINELKEENNENNNIIDNKDKGENMKNKIWLDNLQLNREELELSKEINDNSLKKEINFTKNLEISEKHLDLLSNTDIGTKFLNIEKQINELKHQNKTQFNQISECQEKILNLQQENEKLKDELINYKFFNDFTLFKKMNSFFLKKILVKYGDKIKVKKEGENIKFNFEEEIKGIKINYLNNFIKIIYSRIKNEENENISIINNMLSYFNNQFSGDNNCKNILEKLLDKEEMKEFSFTLFCENNDIKNFIIDKFNLK